MDLLPQCIILFLDETISKRNQPYEVGPLHTKSYRTSIESSLLLAVSRQFVLTLSQNLILANKRKAEKKRTRKPQSDQYVSN